MKLCRFQTLKFAIKDLGRSGNELQAQTLNGILEGSSVYEIRGDFFERASALGGSGPRTR